MLTSINIVMNMDIVNFNFKEVYMFKIGDKVRGKYEGAFGEATAEGIVSLKLIADILIIKCDTGCYIPLSECWDIELI